MAFGISNFIVTFIMVIIQFKFTIFTKFASQTKVNEQSFTTIISTHLNFKQSIETIMEFIFIKLKILAS